MAVKSAFVSQVGILDECRQSDLSPAEWQDIRSRINHANGHHVAHCIACGEPVLVKAASSLRKGAHFAHYRDGGRNCPWGDDPGRSPDAVKASIFGGNQESELHAYICARVLELVGADPRFVAGSGEVNKYLRPENGVRGRWPDVRFELSGVGRFAVEVQLAPSVPPEIIGRGEFYRREKRNLIWLLPSYSYELIERAFASDIAYEAGGNFFSLDGEADSASVSQGTLVLRAAWRGKNGLEHKLVNLDELTYTPDFRPYATNARAESIFRNAEEHRSEIAARLREMKLTGGPRDRYLPAQCLTGNHRCDHGNERLLLILFDIWSWANTGHFQFLYEGSNLASGVNSYLLSQDGRARTAIIEKMLRRTVLGKELAASSERKISEGLAVEQIPADDACAAFAMSLFPEVFRDDLRGDEPRLAAHPLWALGHAAE